MDSYQRMQLGDGLVWVSWVSLDFFCAKPTWVATMRWGQGGVCLAPRRSAWLLLATCTILTLSARGRQAQRRRAWWPGAQTPQGCKSGPQYHIRLWAEQRCWLGVWGQLVEERQDGSWLWFQEQVPSRDSSSSYKPSFSEILRGKRLLDPGPASRRHMKSGSSCTKGGLWWWLWRITQIPFWERLAAPRLGVLLVTAFSCHPS